MRLLLSTTIMILILLPTICFGEIGEGMERDFYKALAAYYTVSDDVVAGFVDGKISAADMSVILLFASKADKDPADIMKLRLDGKSWTEIYKSQNLEPGIFYFLIAGDIPSAIYGPLIAKFRETPQNQWANLDLSDTEIINLVNLRFISSQNDYSVFEIMEMRDKGKDFIRINHDVMRIKEDMVKEAKAKAKAKAKKDAEGE